MRPEMYGYCALYAAIMRPGVTVEQTLSVIFEDSSVYTLPRGPHGKEWDVDLDRVIEQHKQGMTWQELGRLYRMNYQTLFSRVRRYKKQLGEDTPLEAMI